jgi:hypothetical protein
MLFQRWTPPFWEGVAQQQATALPAPATQYYYKLSSFIVRDPQMLVGTSPKAVRFISTSFTQRALRLKLHLLELPTELIDAILDEGI